MIVRPERRGGPRRSHGLLVVLASVMPGMAIAQTLPLAPYGSSLLTGPTLGAPRTQDPYAQPPRREEPYTFTPALELRETLTNNVELAPRDQRQGDAVTQITPSLFVNGVGAHTSLRGEVAVPVVLYARTGAENNTVWPRVHLLGNVSALDNVLNVDGLVSIQQQFLTPFGAQPVDLTNATENRYRTETYAVSPYVKGIASNGIAYELRNNNVWTNLSGAPIELSNQQFYQVRGAASYTQSQLGWRTNFDWSRTILNENSETTMRLVRFEPVYNVTPGLRLTASIGYEDNDFTLTSSRDAIYGVGAEWRPTERSQVTARWEHRFFGSSYVLAASHRSPLSFFRLSASRNITTYPQQLGTLTPGLPVEGLLNQLFQSQFPNEGERQQFVEQFITDRGLPTVLATPVTLYAERVLLLQSVSASAALIGARNTIVFSLFNVKSEPIAGSGSALPVILSPADNNTQTGGSIVWTHTLAPKLLLTATLQGTRTTANPPFSATTNQGVANVLISTPISPRTTVFAGARYQTLSSDVASDFTEAAIFAGFRYLFK